MTQNELMQPRYKVIADYPGRPHSMPVGHILTLNKYGASKWWHEYTDDEPIHIDEGSTKYPVVLRQLQWWEGRKPEDMPEYVKSPHGRVSNARFDLEETSAWFMYLDNEVVPYSPICWLPATEQEYKDYLTSTTRQD